MDSTDIVVEGRDERDANGLNNTVNTLSVLQEARARASAVTCHNCRV